MIKLLDAEVVDSKQFIHADGSIETISLYHTNETFAGTEGSKGNTNVKLDWFHMVCPSTNTNYMIPTCPSFPTVDEAVVFSRPEAVPADIPYKWFSRS